MVRLTLEGGVAELVLDRPASRNALDLAGIEELAAAVERLEGFQGVGLILRGEGGFFCAGSDLGLVRAGLGDAEVGAQVARRMHEITGRLRRLPLVSVAAIEGGAVGGGAELATATDFRIMAEDARIHFVHSRLGMAPGWGGAGRLTRLVGRRAALRLMAFAEPVQAAEALALGLVDALAPTGGARDAAQAWLAPLAERSSASVRAIKRAVAAAEELAPDEAAELERAAFVEVWSKADPRRLGRP